MRVVTVGGTGGRKELAEHIASGIPDSWLIVLGGQGPTRTGTDVEEIAGVGIEDTRSGWPDLIEADGIIIVDANVVFADTRPVIALFLTELPLDRLDDAQLAAARQAEIVIVDTRPLHGESELGLEKSIKLETGAAKVLIYSDAEDKDRAFGKVLDVVRSKLGGVQMPDEVPDKVVEAVKREAEGGRLSCERAQQLARELEVPIPVVGRALDLLNIKIIKCQLGCF